MTNDLRKNILIITAAIILIAVWVFDECDFFNQSSQTTTTYQYQNTGEYVTEDNLTLYGLGIFTKVDDKFYGIGASYHKTDKAYSAELSTLSPIEADSIQYFEDRGNSVAVYGASYYNVLHKQNNDVLVSTIDLKDKCYMLKIVDTGYLEWTHSWASFKTWFNHNYVNDVLIAEENESIDHEIRKTRLLDATNSLGIKLTNGLFLAENKVKLKVGYTYHDKTTDDEFSFERYCLIASTNSNDVYKLDVSDWTNGYQTLDTSNLAQGRYLLVTTYNDIIEWIKNPSASSSVYQIIIE